MIGKPIALIQVPNQRAFRSAAAAQYCGVEQHALTRYTEAGLIEARVLNGQRVYLLEEMDRFLESLPVWDNTGRSQPAPATSERSNHAGR